MARRYYSSTAVVTSLTGGINDSVTSITVASTSGFPGSTPYTLVLDRGTASEEIVEVTGVAGTTLTVTRGVDGSSAKAHSAAAAVEHGVSARDFDEANAHVNDTTGDPHPQYATDVALTAGLAAAQVSNVWLPATAFGFTAIGTPSLQSVNGVPAWLMDATSEEGVATSALAAPQANWSTIDIDLWWTEPVEGGGNVVWDLQYSVNVADDSAVSMGTAVAETAQGGAGAIVQTLRLATGVAVTPGTVGFFQVIRRAASVSDTFSADAAFLGLMLRRAS